MYSKTPKVLHSIGGKPMLARVVETAQSLSPEKIHVVIGHGSEQIKSSLSSLEVNWVVQEQQLGTGHAVMQALPSIPADRQVLVLSGDVPLIQTQTLTALIKACEPAAGYDCALGLLVASAPDPYGLGRIIRNEAGAIQAIVEEKDANADECLINEIYTGICLGPASAFGQWLPQLKSNNAQAEYYLTEIIRMAVTDKFPIVSYAAPEFTDTQGVNNRLQLQQLERAWQVRNTNELMLAGVTLADASRVDVRGKLTCGMDVCIDVNTIFKGDVHLGDGCIIGPNCVLNNVTLGNNCEIFPNSVLENCHLENNCDIGPFARLRPGTKLASNCKIGNFVETKNAVFAEGSKASHLTYLGDVTVGKNVNIGAGTITCNYDGANKHQTVIEDGVFIGSDTQLVAPVIIGENATIGAGSTIRRNVPPGELTLTESKQKTIYGWERPKKR